TPGQYQPISQDYRCQKHGVKPLECRAVDQGILGQRIQQQRQNGKGKPAMELKMQIKLYRQLVNCRTSATRSGNRTQTPHPHGRGDYQIQAGLNKYRYRRPNVAVGPPQKINKYVTCQNVERRTANGNAPVSLEGKGDYHPDHRELGKRKSPTIDRP